MSADDRLDDIVVNHFEDGEGAEAVARCYVDGYPTGLDCTCGHAHDRHSGQDDNTRCMSYIYQPDCECKAFIPSPGSVASLWEDAKAMHAALRAVLDLCGSEDQILVGGRRTGKTAAMARIQVAHELHIAIAAALEEVAR